MPNQKSRTTTGRYRSVRSDTKMGTIEERYGVNLGVRSNMKLGNYLEKKGYSSLSSMLKSEKK